MTEQLTAARARRTLFKLWLTETGIYQIGLILLPLIFIGVAIIRGELEPIGQIAVVALYAINALLYAVRWERRRIINYTAYRLATALHITETASTEFRAMLADIESKEPTDA